MRTFLLLCLLAAVAYAQQCGDGVIDSGEACDDGNAYEDDGCNNNCEIDTRFFCRGEPSECFPLVPDHCVPRQQRPTGETTTAQSFTTTEATTNEPTSVTGSTTTTNFPSSSPSGNCPPISCPTDCDFTTHKYRLSRDSDGCQYCRCVPRNNQGNQDDSYSRKRRAVSTVETTLNPFTTEVPTTGENECPLNPVSVTNCTCTSGYRVAWEFFDDCPVCYCIPIFPDRAPDICIRNITTYGENCSCDEGCHSCEWLGGRVVRRAANSPCVSCLTRFLYRGNCIETCPPGTQAQGTEDYLRRCVVGRTGNETTTEAPTTELSTTGETTTAETTTGETTTGETTTGETTTGETTTGEVTTAENGTTTVIILTCNGLPDPPLCVNYTLNCTQIIGNITVNETCPVICNTCNETTTTNSAVITTTSAAAAANIIEGAAIANNVAAVANTANPGLIVGMSVLAVVLVAAAVGVIIKNRRQRRNPVEIYGPAEVRVEEVGDKRS